jgi:hypothetical protein
MEVFNASLKSVEANDPTLNEPINDRFKACLKSFGIGLAT